jgi:hypothetical protein
MRRLSARTGDKRRAISEVAQKGRRVKDLRRLMNHPDLWMQAYLNIQGNQGALTRGTDTVTRDGYSPARAANLVELIREKQYKPEPVRRVRIPTKVAGKMRPLGMPSADDKRGQEVVRMILAQIYEPLFKDSAYGFRPGKSCHTALKSMQRGWTGTKWLVDIDIKGYVNNSDHDILMDLLKKRIEDTQFLDLTRDMLKVGYVEDWQYHKTYSGTPQGGIVTLPTKLPTFWESTRRACHGHNGDPGMVMGFWGRHSSEWRLATAPRHGSTEASVARRVRTRSTPLEGRLTCEPSRVGSACVAQAYARVVPITRRPAPRAGSPPQTESAPPLQHVGGRPQA